MKKSRAARSKPKPAKLTPSKHLKAIDEFWRVKEAAATKGSPAALRAAIRRPIKLLAEGDSWFDYPPHRDVIDWLKADWGYNIENVAKAGSSAYAMAYGPDDDGFWDFLNRDPSQLDECVRLLEKHRPDGFLLSAGGNDIAGPEFVILVNHILAQPSGLNKKVLLGVIEDSLRPAYDHIIQVIRAKANQIGLGDIPIFLHGYAYPFPDGRGVLGRFPWNVGPWFDPSFSLKGYPRGSDADLKLRRAVTNELMDGFNAMVAKIATDYAKVHYIDLRPLLKNIGDWSNELHPTVDSFKAVAKTFHETITKVIQ
jgi:lysophospholipase L1-like esterase